MKVVAVVQARLGSSRLPGKVLAEINGFPMLGHVLERAKAIKGVDAVVLTTPMPEAPQMRGLPGVDRWVPHTPPDVLAGFAEAAQRAEADIVMRLTGDCPLLDPMLCRAVLERVLAGAAYATNARESSFGLDCQVFTRELLQSAHKWAIGQDREHVCPWMEAEQNLIAYKPLPAELTDVHWAVDTQEDLDRVRAIYAHLTPGDFSWQATLRAAREAGV